MTPVDRERLIRLNLIPDAGSARLRRALDAFGGLDRLWAASVSELQQAAGLSRPFAERLAAARQDDARFERELALAERCGVAILTLADAAYPARLRTIPDPPLALYVRGALAAADEAAVAVVGARRASLYGLQCADRLSQDLALRGLTVVSGLAVGIDGAAHRGALRAGGRTLAVLGSGLARVYPPAHERLAEQVAGQGAVLSEYPLEAEPFPGHFPQRNRLISGLSLGVVVVEASARSGALITADCALEQGREVFAVPGPMTSATSEGTHRLLKQGARLVTSVEDILEELRLWSPAGTSRGATSRARPSGRVEGTDAPHVLPEPARRILACVREGEPQDIDTIVSRSGLPTSAVSSALLQLELQRLVQQLPGKQFVRSGRTRCASR
jgi:DNA processing protein